MSSKFALLTEVERDYNNIIQLSGCEEVSHKTRSELATELVIYSLVDVERKGRGEHGVDFYISPTGLVERKALLDALKDLIV